MSSVGDRTSPPRYVGRLVLLGLLLLVTVMGFFIWKFASAGRDPARFPPPTRGSPGR